MTHIAKWKQLSREQLVQLVNESHSFYELAEKIGYAKQGGSTQTSLKQAVKELEIDVSHFTGRAWNKGNYDYSSFTKGSIKKNGKTTLKPLIALRGRQCECCKATEWMGQAINLEIHHIDGDRSNNELDNLKLLCPNCHSYTETFCHKSKYQYVEENDYVQALRENNTIHSALKQLGLTASAGNYERARELIVKYQLNHLYQEHSDEKSPK